MTQDDQTGDQDGGATTMDDAATDNSGSAPSDSGSGLSDTSASGSGASDAGSGSPDSGAATDAGGGDQTPAADLTVGAIQPTSVDADPSIASSSGAASTASTDVGSSNAVATDAESADEGGGAGGGSVVGDLVTVGKAVASIMTASSPDYGMKSNPVSVLPQGADPATMVGISADPHELRVVVAMDNRAGMEVCNLPIVVQWRYGGSIGGKGHYITNASAFLDTGADIGLFYKGEVTAALQNPFNAGSDPKDMLAQVDVHIEIKVTDKTSPANLFIVLEGNIRGDGAGKLAQRP